METPCDKIPCRFFWHYFPRFSPSLSLSGLSHPYTLHYHCRLTFSSLPICCLQLRRRGNLRGDHNHLNITIIIGIAKPALHSSYSQVKKGGSSAEMSLLATGKKKTHRDGMSNVLAVKRRKMKSKHEQIFHFLTPVVHCAAWLTYGTFSNFVICVVPEILVRGDLVNTNVIQFLSERKKTLREDLLCEFVGAFCYLSYCYGCVIQSVYLLVIIV